MAVTGVAMAAARDWEEAEAARAVTVMAAARDWEEAEAVPVAMQSVTVARASIHAPRVVVGGPRARLCLEAGLDEHLVTVAEGGGAVEHQVHVRCINAQHVPRPDVLVEGDDIHRHCSRTTNARRRACPCR